MNMPKSRDIRAKKNSQRKPPVTWEKNFHVTGGYCFAYQSSVRRTGFALRGHDISDIGKRMAREAEDT